MTRSFLFAFIFALLQVSTLWATDDRGHVRNAPATSAASSVQRSGTSPAQGNDSDDVSPEEAAVRAKNLEMIEQLQGCANFDMATKKCLDGAAPAMNVNSSTPARDPAAIGAECIKATDDATNTCNFNSSPGAKVAVQMADQMRGQLNAASMSSPAAMCSKMGSISQAIDAAVAAFSGYCTTAYSDCESACSSDIEQLKAAINANPTTSAALSDRLAEVQKSSKACAKLSGNVANVFQNIGSYAALEQAKSQYCGQQTDALAALCKSDPNNMLCKNQKSASCADPNFAASSTVCICQANPADPRCGSQGSGLQAYNPAAPGGGKGAGGAADGGALGDFGGTGGNNGIAGAGLNGSGGNGDPGGGGARAGFGRGGGGGLSMGGGGGTGGPGGKAGAGAGGAAGGNGPNAKIIAGYGVGGTGSAGAYGHVGGGAAGGAGAVGRNGFGAGKAGVDLRKFMPGGQMDPSRGLAGVSGPDGITGPNTDIWQKIQMRYYSVGPSLMP